MNGNKLSPTDYQIFLFKALVFLSLAWGGFALALSGFFYAPLAWGAALALGALITKLALKHRMLLKISREMLLANLAVITVALVFSFFSTPTVFSGRDQGAISEAAIRLSQNHTFAFSTPASSEFFKLHEKGRAQNFPGFYYTSDGQLITQFPLVYITWLALFFSLFGLAGFAVANAALLYFFLLTFYLLTRLFLDTWPALPTMLFAATSFIFMWFAKFTLSENMALPILWLSILTLMLFLKNQRRLHYITFLASAILLCFTRIEGLAFLATSILIIACHKDAREYIQEKSLYRFFLPMGIFAVFLAANTIVDLNFYREIAKALLPSVKPPQAQFLGNLKNAALPDFYTGKIFFLYGMLSFFLLGAFSIARLTWQKQYYKLMPFVITLPTVIYLLDSHISSDQPWMLRRYMFSLLPIAIFYSGLLLGEWLEKKPTAQQTKNFRALALGLSALLLLGNLPAFLRYLPYSENKNLLAQTQTLSERFSERDLILVDREVTTDGWSMITGPLGFLYGKQAVYFFNTQDLAKLDLTPFENVYLIAPNEQAGYYASSVISKRLSAAGEYSFTFSRLDNRKDDPLEAAHFPLKKLIQVEGKIFKIAK